MLSLDILFENLDITVHPFVLCCAENEVSLSLCPRSVATRYANIFPSEVMRFVTPYTGKTPCISLAWNIDSEAKPGDAAPGGLPGS